VTAGDLFDGLPLSYAVDDGMPFPGWAPPPLDEAEAQDRYASGERFAVVAGEATDPTAALVLDRRNGRVVVTDTAPPRRLVFSGKDPLAVHEAYWQAEHQGQLVELSAERTGPDLLRVRRRPVGVPVWVEELFAARPVQPGDREHWPEFGDWSGLARIERGDGDWWQISTDELVDADGWLLDVLDELDLAERWRSLARKHDAPRAYGLPPPVQAKLAEPRDWRPQGRRWRKAASAGGATLLVDVSFVAGAGGGSDATMTVTRDPVEVQLTLPAASARLEARRSGHVGNPAQPRPSASAQVAIAAVLDLAGEVFEATREAIADGALPDGWRRLRG
jgi:hypothetical protein